MRDCHRLPSAFLCFLLFVGHCSSARRGEAQSSVGPARTFQAAAFGTKGNGTTDDTAALRKAVQAAMAAGGGRVVLPCGQFLVNEPAEMAPGKRSVLYFAHASRITLEGQGACTHLFSLLPQKSVIEFDDSSEITITSLKISAVNARYIETFGLDGGSAIRFNGVLQGSIHNVEIDGATAGAIYLTAGTSHVTVDDNSIHDTYGAGIWEDDCGGENNKNCLPSKPPTYNVYERNTLVNTTQAALAAIDLDDGNASSYAIVRDNRVSWTHAPLKNNNQVHCIQLNNVSNASVIHNQCTGTPWDSIVITTGDHGSSTDNLIQDNVVNSSGLSEIGGAGIVVYNSPTGKGVSAFVIKGNTLKMSACDGISLYSASAIMGIHDGHITANTIIDADQQHVGTCSGLHLVRVSSTQVEGNTIDGHGRSTAAGITVQESPGLGTPLTSKSNHVVGILGRELDIR